MKKKFKSISEEAKESAFSPYKRDKEVSFRKVLSTGSTLLDLAICGERVRGGGIPGGIVAEFFGRSQTGKTALLAEICASAQVNGGEVAFKDPEARLDKEYCRIYGMDLDKKQYTKPDTVTELFDSFWGWKPKNPDAINVQACDSLAALSTNLELSDKGDKMGMRRAKEFSEGLRKTCRIVEKNNWLIVCSNQIRQGDHGDISPGGNALPFYASVRIKVVKAFKKPMIERERNINPDGEEKKLKKIIGIHSECTVIKSVGIPYRTAPIYIVFGYGIDDIRGNLQWIKDMTRSTKYDAIEKEFQSIDQAIKCIETNKYQLKLRKKVIKLWEYIEEKFQVERQLKKRR